MRKENCTGYGRIYLSTAPNGRRKLHRLHKNLFIKFFGL
jgi:hypothetical protein